MMKKLFLLFVLSACFFFCACSDKDVAGISSVETQNAFLIRVVHNDSLPAVNAVAHVRSADFVRNIAEDSAETQFFREYRTDSLGCIRIDSLAVDTAMIEIIDKGDGVIRKIHAAEVQDGDSVQFVLEKTGSLRGKVYLPEGVDYAWVQVYGIDRLVKTDSRGFYELDSLAPYGEYSLQVVIGDTVSIFIFSTCAPSAIAGTETVTVSNFFQSPVFGTFTVATFFSSTSTEKNVLSLGDETRAVSVRESFLAVFTV